MVGRREEGMVGRVQCEDDREKLRAHAARAEGVSRGGRISANGIGGVRQCALSYGRIEPVTWLEFGQARDNHKWPARGKRPDDEPARVGEHLTRSFRADAACQCQAVL